MPLQVDSPVVAEIEAVDKVFSDFISQANRQYSTEYLMKLAFLAGLEYGHSAVYDKQICKNIERFYDKQIRY